MQYETLKCLHLQPKIISRNEVGVALEKNSFMYYISNNQTIRNKKVAEKFES